MSFDPANEEALQTTSRSRSASVESARDTGRHSASLAEHQSAFVAPTSPVLTLFALPKPFVGHIGVIQRNALRSWRELSPYIEVILFGDEIGTAEYAETNGFRHVPEFDRNSHGTPLLDSVFRRANEMANGKMVMYANCDIMFTTDLLPALETLDESDIGEFLAIGRRHDIDITEMIDFAEPNLEEQLRARLLREAKLAPVVCKDYFLFRQGQYETIPAFAIGRGNWDNWIVQDAISKPIPVIELTGEVTAIHQNHGYGHLSQGRLEAYVKGAEAEENRRLAGGRHLVAGCASTWKLRHGRIEKLQRPLASAFLSDLPRFGRLMTDLFWTSPRQSKGLGKKVESTRQV